MSKVAPAKSLTSSTPLSELLKDLHEHGAESILRLTAQLTPEVTQRLLRHNHLALLPTPVGDLVVLGVKGRRALGLSPFYRSPPEAAVTQFLRRCVREGLEKRGWRYRGKHNRSLLVFAAPKGKVYLAVRWGDYGVRSARRLLKTHGALIIKEGGCLLIVNRHPHHLQPLVGRAGGTLMVRCLDDFWRA